MKKIDRRSVKKSAEKTVYLLPAAIIFATFMIWPILQNFYLSTLEWNMVSPNKIFVGLGNYISIFKDPEFYNALTNTVQYVVILLIFNFALPYFVSYILARMVKKGTQIYRSLFFFPTLLSFAVASIIFLFLYNPVSGPLADAFSRMGLVAPNLLKTPNLVIWALSIITAWRCFGYNMVVFLAAVIDVPVELIEAAQLEGASNWHIFWKIVTPLTASTLLYVFIITFVFGIQYVFTPMHMLTQGGPNQASTNLVYMIYQYGFNYFRTGSSAAIAVISLVVFMLVVIIQKALEKKVHYEN